MKPEQAWEHVKALSPDAECITPYYGSSDAANVQLGNGRSYSIPIAIDWPEGVDRWPPTCKKSSQVEYIEPDQRHVGLEVEVAYYNDGPFYALPFLAALPKDRIARFIASRPGPDWEAFSFARVPADPMKDAPKDRVIEGYVDNKWIRIWRNYVDGYWRSESPDEVNPVAWREVQK